MHQYYNHFAICLGSVIIFANSVPIADKKKTVNLNLNVIHSDYTKLINLYWVPKYLCNISSIIFVTRFSLKSNILSTYTNLSQTLLSLRITVVQFDHIKE